MPRRAWSSTVSYLRTSERTTFNHCRQKWWWSYHDKLRPRMEAPALRFGTLVHKALELYYQADVQGRKRKALPGLFEKLYKDELKQTREEWPEWRDEEDEWHDYLELGVVMMEGYLEYVAPQEREYVTLATEQRFQMPIAVPRSHWANTPLAPPSPTIYVGTLDRVLYHRPTRRLLFGDYKTTKTDPTKTQHLALDEQAGSYWAYGPSWLRREGSESMGLRKQLNHRIMGLMPSDRKSIRAALNTGRFDGILYDFMKKALPDKRPTNEQGHALNKDGTVSKVQPGPLFHREPCYRDQADRDKVIERIYLDAVEIGQVLRGERAVKKSPDRFTCFTPRCQFFDMCELHETDTGWEEFRNATMVQWDPYDTYYIDWDELG